MVNISTVWKYAFQLAYSNKNLYYLHHMYMYTIGEGSFISEQCEV